MKIVVNEEDMKPDVKNRWFDARISGDNLKVEDFYLGAHMLNTAQVIVFESAYISVKKILKK